MQTETRTKAVDYKVYIAEDGKEFDKKSDCELHEKFLHGDAKECPECHGNGELWEEYQDTNYHTGAPETYTRFYKCPKCQGKGYLIKKVKTQTFWV